MGLSAAFVVINIEEAGLTGPTKGWEKLISACTKQAQ
jgi:hypothetical protein